MAPCGFVSGASLIQIGSLRKPGDISFFLSFTFLSSTLDHQVLVHERTATIIHPLFCYFIYLSLIMWYWSSIIFCITLYFSLQFWWYLPYIFKYFNCSVCVCICVCVLTIFHILMNLAICFFLSCNRWWLKEYNINIITFSLLDSIFFYLFTFKLLVFLKLKWASYTEHIVESYLFIFHSASLYFWMQNLIHLCLILVTNTCYCHFSNWFNVLLFHFFPLLLSLFVIY